MAEGTRYYAHSCIFAFSGSEATSIRSRNVPAVSFYYGISFTLRSPRFRRYTPVALCRFVLLVEKISPGLLIPAVEVAPALPVKS